jgi:hypothetical protein
LLLSINVLERLHDVVLGVTGHNLDALGQFHIDVCLDWSLRVGHNKVNLAKGPTENDAKHYHKPYCKPRYNRSIGFKVVHAVDLLSAM